ncbi:MAG: hypothetical protein UX11_C0035G0003 [Candidatus Collierbacteria bacterium GW2011_GWC2_45_40]|nr:MAG: hypothetical protein UX11_C0035G0003 [Candidatus Collierbacteria bacterium GW2011_GWC2_45_40]
MYNAANMFNSNNKRKHRIVWTVISLLAALGMVASLILPLFS